MRASHDCDTFARVSHDSLWIFVRASHDSRETFVRVSRDVRANFNVLFLAIKSQNGLIYVAYLSHCADHGNFLAMCLRMSAKGWRRVRDGFATYAMTWRRFCDDFCRTKSITCLKLWRTVRDEFAMHARTLRYHANVSRQFATVLRIDSQTHRELVASQ